MKKIEPGLAKTKGWRYRQSGEAVAPGFIQGVPAQRDELNEKKLAPMGPAKLCPDLPMTSNRQNFYIGGFMIWRARSSNN
jgi:hypothetical protein